MSQPKNYVNFTWTLSPHTHMSQEKSAKIDIYKQERQSRIRIIYPNMCQANRVSQGEEGGRDLIRQVNKVMTSSSEYASTTTQMKGSLFFVVFLRGGD